AGRAEGEDVVRRGRAHRGDELGEDRAAEDAEDPAQAERARIAFRPLAERRADDGQLEERDREREGREERAPGREEAEAEAGIGAPASVGALGQSRESTPRPGAS